jgi:transcriptional regulator with PAS, ATPase and Fis domain
LPGAHFFAPGDPQRADARAPNRSEERAPGGVPAGVVRPERAHYASRAGGSVDPVMTRDTNSARDLASIPDAIYKRAVADLFDLFEQLCDGALAVDADARIAWISEKYVSLLGIPDGKSVIGRDVEEVIPNSLMRQVVTTGRPILLDIMQFGDRWFVVTRIPLFDGKGKVVGAVGFVLYDRVDYLKPLVSKFVQLQTALASVQRQLDAHRRAKYNFSQFIGSSPAILEVKRLGRKAAQLDATVLLIGQTGTGKELLAQAIHNASPRAAAPFIAVNVAAVPETLMEAEFFGVAPGAYTGADRKGRDGKFKIADGGTLFLDEVADMPLAVQAKMLRALQEQEIEPLGSNKVTKLDVRVVAATSRDLKDLVAQGKFRSDLYFRLNVLPIVIPPLKERLGDIEALCEAMLEQIAARSGQPQRELEPAAMDLLKGYDWPGNVRELRNVLERTAMQSERTSLRAVDLAPVLPLGPSAVQRGRHSHRGARPLADAVAEVERATIVAALAVADGKKATAARILGISRSKLYDKMTDLGIVSEIPT